MTRVKLTAQATGAAVAVGGLAMPAMAHPGLHHGMSFGELAQHLATGWHLFVLVAATVGGAAVLVLTLRRDERARGTRRGPGERS